jgi:hypothetical protein
MCRSLDSQPAWEGTNVQTVATYPCSPKTSAGSLVEGTVSVCPIWRCVTATRSGREVLYPLNPAWLSIHPTPTCAPLYSPS